MAKKKAKNKGVRTTEWAIGQPLPASKKKAKLDDAQNALDIVRHAIAEPLVPPKRTARDPLKVKRQRNKSPKR
jgi:hypothetical protein